MATLSVNGTVVNQSRVTAEPDTSASVELSWTPGAPGTYELRVEVNDESGELVKVETYVIEVAVPPLPDLTLVDLRVQPSEFGPGDAVTVYVTVANVGDAESPSAPIAVTEEPTGRVVYFGEVEPLPPGGEEVLSFDYQVPGEEGEYSLVVNLDPENEIEESDEDNSFGFEFPVSPAETEAPLPPPTETEAPTQPPTSPTAPTETGRPPAEEEGEVPTAVLVVGAAIAGAVASYLAWRSFYFPTGPGEAPAARCCLDWNVRPGGTILKTVKPVLRYVEATEGGRGGETLYVKALFAPIGGYLPLVAKCVNVDWVDARGILKGCEGGSGGEAGAVHVPIPENVSFRWEILSGPGYLLSTPPLSHSHSSVAEGPAAIYVAPPFVMEDPGRRIRERIREGREALIRLTVDDPEGQLKGLDSPIEERHFRIVLVGQGLALRDPTLNEPLDESDLGRWADYSEVGDAISLDEFDWIRPGRTPEPSSGEVKRIEARLEEVRRRRRAEEEALRQREGLLREKRRALERAERELRRMNSELGRVEGQLEDPWRAWRGARGEARRRVEGRYKPEIEELRRKRRELWRSHLEEVRRAREEGRSDEYVTELNRRFGEQSAEIDREIGGLLRRMVSEIGEAQREIGLPSQPGPGLERHLESLRRRREELARALDGKRREVEALRREVEELEGAVEDLRGRVEDLRSEEEGWRSSLESAKARAGAEEECGPAFGWEDAKSIEGELLTPLRLYDRDSLDSESPTPERCQIEVRPREILILRARAEDVDRLRLWIEDGQSVELEVKDWLRFEWSSRWVDGGRHGVGPGKFLVTREGETVIFLAPEEEGDVEITCEIYDSGIQHRDGRLERSTKLRVRGPDPLSSIEEGLKELEKIIHRPSEGEWERPDYDRRPSERLGDLERWMVIDARTTRHCLEQVTEECSYNLRVLWWSDLLWNVGNALLAVASIGAAIATTASAVGRVAAAPKLRDVIFTWLSTSAGAASTATALVPYRWDLSTLQGKLTKGAISAYRDWVKGLGEKARWLGPAVPAEELEAPPCEPRVRSLEREVHGALRVAKGTAQSIWNTYVDTTQKITRGINEALDRASKVEASCVLVRHFVQNLVFLLSLIRPPSELLSRLRRLLEGAEWDSLREALSPLARIISQERESLTISGLIDVLTEAKGIFDEELRRQEDIFLGLERLGVR